MDLKEHIITQSDCLFCQYGIKSVTMDDIAKHLGMSKKTIYTHFSDKNDLVYTLITNKLKNQDCEMDQTLKNSENAVHELFQAVTQLQIMLSNMNPMLFYDMQKYHPKAWLVFKNFREEKIFQVIRNNLERGIKEGFYRQEINLDIITRLRLEQIDLVFSNAYFQLSKYSTAQVMKEITEHFLYGLCTLKGHKLVNKYKQIIDED